MSRLSVPCGVNFVKYDRRTGYVRATILAHKLAHETTEQKRNPVKTRDSGGLFGVPTGYDKTPRIFNRCGVFCA